MTTLTELKEIISGATKGPWKKDFRSSNGGKTVVVIGATSDFPVAYCKSVGMQYICQDNAQFIAISRQALPALIEVAEEMAEALSDLLDHARSCEILGFKDAGKYEKALQRWQSFKRGEY